MGAVVLRILYDPCRTGKCLFIIRMFLRGRRYIPVGSEIGIEITRFDEAYLNAERMDFYG